MKTVDYYREHWQDAEERTVEKIAGQRLPEGKGDSGKRLLDGRYTAVTFTACHVMNEVAENGLREKEREKRKKIQAS